MLYNTLSRSKEEFSPIDSKEVRMFVCGQTVYDDAHIGHAKNYINFDFIARWLRRRGYRLRYVQNITDIDDKIIRRAAEEGATPMELARKYEARFMEDMDAIGVRKNVDMYPRSHDFINEIEKQIQLLADKSYAYLLDGDVYYDVSRFADYTRLSGMDISELGRHRIEPREGKRNPCDFALWKAAKEGEPSWTIGVRFGGKETELKGRPGWHIEDTAMTHQIFGSQYDIHGGAIELIFPHHTNEIAQAEAAFGVKPFVKYWLHTGVMLIKGEKMSKSRRNFIRIRDLLKEYDAEALRLLVCSTHYRKDIPYTDELMKNAASRLRYLQASFSVFYNAKLADSALDGPPAQICAALEEGFSKAMDDDFNTPLALSALVAAIEKLRIHAETSPGISRAAKEDAVSKVLSLANVLGIFEDGAYMQKLPEEAAGLIKERERLRKQKKYGEADAIRERLAADFSITVEDSEYGPVWYRKG